MPYASVNGTSLYYEEQGSGPHLVVAHGLLGSVALLPLFGERLEALARRGLHVVAYDARGHGRSGYTTDRGDYSWGALAGDMRGLMDALGMERASAYGGSMGAGTALMLALEEPERVERLVLRAPPPFGRSLSAVRGMFLGLAMLYRLFGSRGAARIVASLPRTRAQQREHPDIDIGGIIASQRREAIVPAICGLLGGPPLPAHRFERIRHPTLVLTHPGDAIHPLDAGELLHERMPHAKLAVAPTQDYWSQNADALAHVVASFVLGDPIARGLPSHKHAVSGPGEALVRDARGA